MAPAQLDLRKYLTKSVDELITRYSEVCNELVTLRVFLGESKAQEHRGKIKEFWANQSGSVAARNRAGDFMVAEISSTILETEGQISALVEERGFIERLLGWEDAITKR